MRVRKTEQGAYRFLTNAPTGLAGFDRQEKINTGNTHSGGEAGARVSQGGGGVRQLRSHVNTNTNLREEKRTVHCSRKRGFHIMNKKNEGIRIIFLKKRGPI